MEQRELEKQLDRTHEWIRSVDQKIGIALVFEVGIISLTGTISYKLASQLYPEISWHDLTTITTTWCLFVYGIIKSLKALLPKLSARASEQSFLYFGAIDSMGLKGYARSLKKLKHTDYIDDLISQIYISSSIANKKHKALADSIKLYIYGGAVWLLSVFIMVLSILNSQ